MGQYFLLVNTKKEEYVCPWCIGTGAKLLEWCANHCAGILPYLIRKSNEGGGGDIENIDECKYAGRWAGDPVYLVGDYDTSGLFDKALKSYRNISQKLAKEYNKFIKVEDLRIREEPCKAHRKSANLIKEVSL
jgi:hypothetical protein